jgi:putative SOS response-associated peptidase YedK
MCGRFSLHATPEDIAEEFERPVMPPWAPRYNIAPTENVLAVRLHHGAAEVEALRWGLIPSWAKDPKKAPLLINAKSETAATKPAFRAAFERRRCLVIADGYYEWQKVGRDKQPYYHRLAGGRPFAFAGLWEFWRRGEQTIKSCTILTTDANEVARPIHDRMPVILDKAARKVWLDPEIEDPAALTDVLRPYAAQEMVVYAVNPAVNKAGNEGPQCIERSTHVNLF